MCFLRRKPEGDLELITFNTDDVPLYAILSHTWTEDGDVTFAELGSGAGKSKSKSKAGYYKIRFCVDKAARG
jgi:hypothetical protein